MNTNLSLNILVWLLGGAICTNAAAIVGKVLVLDSPNQWVLAADAKNIGKQQKWYNSPHADAKPTRMPGSMQETLGEYHGVAWYWRTINIPRNPHANGRYLLRFWSIDYFIEVWVNGRPVGNHEGVDTMVEMDITEAVKPDADNLVAVRLINPGNTPVDGFVIRECPGRNKFEPWGPGSTYNRAASWIRWNCSSPPRCGWSRYTSSPTGRPARLRPK